MKFYKNFIAFVFSGAIGVGLISALGWFFFALFFLNPAASPPLYSSLVVGLFGLGLGALSAALGFVILLGIGLWNRWPVERFEIPLFVLLALAASAWLGPMKLFGGPGFLIFPLLPGIASCWLFVKLSKTYIRILFLKNESNR